MKQHTLPSCDNPSRTPTPRLPINIPGLLRCRLTIPRLVPITSGIFTKSISGSSMLSRSCIRNLTKRKTSSPSFAGSIQKWSTVTKFYQRNSLLIKIPSTSALFAASMLTAGWIIMSDANSEDSNLCLTPSSMPVQKRWWIIMSMSSVKPWCRTDKKSLVMVNIHKSQLPSPSNTMPEQPRLKKNLWRLQPMNRQCSEKETYPVRRGQDKPEEFKSSGYCHGTSWTDNKQDGSQRFFTTYD